MSNHSAERLIKLMTAARQSPDFGVRLLAQLPSAARAEALRCWSHGTPVPAAVETRPGLRKCTPRGAKPMKTPQSVQLEAFARTIGRVG
jgi:hypothetical protein